MQTPNGRSEPAQGLRRHTESERLSDTDLARAISSGDRTAFAPLVERHLRRILQIARRLSGNDADAEDIAQEVFARLWQQISSLTIDDRGLRPWLVRVTSNLAVDIHRRRKDHNPDRLDDLLAADDQRRDAEQRDLERHLDRALQSLPERQRIALVLFHYEQFTLQETAHALETTTHAVESLLARARRKLQIELKDVWQELIPNRGDRP